MIVDVSRLRLTIHTKDGAENDDSVLSSLIHSSSLVIFCVFRRTSPMSLTYLLYVCSIYVRCFRLDSQCSDLFGRCTKEWIGNREREAIGGKG